MSTPVPHAQIRVLLLENIHRSAVEMFAELGVHVETVTGALKEDELIARLEGVHILGIRSKTRVTEKVLAAAKDRRPGPPARSRRSIPGSQIPTPLGSS